MKRALLLTICLVMASSMAFAQAGNIGVFADAAGTSCDLTFAGYMTAYVVHVNSPGAKASQFTVGVYAVGLTRVGTNSPFNFIGNPDDGLAIAYGTCQVSPTHIFDLTYVGAATACEYLMIEADPTATPPGIYMTDCTDPVPLLYEIPKGGMAYINNDGSCPCDVPAEDTSWGQIKALYQ